jgi:hypothetical protein
MENRALPRNCLDRRSHGLFKAIDPNVWTGCRSQVRVLSEVADMYPAC